MAWGTKELKEYVERIFDEKDAQAEFARKQLETAVAEAKATTRESMAEAKAAADGVTEAMTKRIDLLESGGAPFASRLDQSLSEMKNDVDALNENMVKTTVLDALREQTLKEAAAQKRQIRNLGYGFVISLLLLVINLSVVAVLHFH